jgi:uncharacterized protein (TIGR03382 family)
VLISPQNGTQMASLRPNLVILESTDPDLDALVYDWELATDATFGTIIAQGANVVPQGAGNMTFPVTVDLDEDTEYCWRVRADDSQTTSTYNTACFFVSTQNDPPAVPTLNNPSNDSTVLTRAPVYTWAPSTDPENDTISYDIEVRDGSGTVVASSNSVGGTVTTMAGVLDNGTTYTWRARAVDSSGAKSEFSADNTFTVDAPIDMPDVIVNGGGCQTSNGSVSMLFALGLVGLVLGRRRRRSR